MRTTQIITKTVITLYLIENISLKFKIQLYCHTRIGTKTIKHFLRNKLDLKRTDNFPDNVIIMQFSHTLLIN